MGGSGRGSSRARLIRRLEALPATTTQEFSTEIRMVVERISEPERKLRKLARDAALSPSVRFAALYGWLLRLRREERYTEYEAVVQRYAHEFAHEPYIYTFHAIVAKNKGDTANLRSAIEYSRHAAELMPDVAGVIHQLAAFIIEYSERSETAIAEELGRAERAVDRAIAITRGRTGHYFETKARLLALRGDYTSARIAIGQAIELEPRETVDYHRRLTEYQATRVRIDLLQQRSRWNNQQEQNRRELEQFKAQQLQLLGLLAAVVAFVATTGNIASKSGATEGLLLIQAMAGALIVVFASFSLVSTRSIWRIACMYAVGVLMLAAPYVLER